MADDREEKLKKVRAELKAKITHLNKTHFLVTIGDKSRVMRLVTDIETGKEEIEILQIAAFRDIFNNKQVQVGINKTTGEPEYKPMGNTWLSHENRLTYSEGTYFLPMKEPLKDGTYQKYNNKLNLWTGFGVEAIPHNKNKINKILAYISNLVCSSDPEYYAYLMGWIAYGFQNPDKHAEVAIVLRGGKGTGKGTLGNLLKTLYGKHAKQINNSKQLTGNFNGHLASICFMFADEAFFAGDHAGEATLKALITERELSIERKGLDIERATNRLKILMASNKDWVIPSSKDERRFFCLDVEEKLSGKEKTTYFNELHKTLEDKQVLSEFLDYLLKMDLSEFNIRKYPETEANQKQRLLSLDPVAKFLIDACEREYLIMGKEQQAPDWFEGKVTTSLIVEAVAQWGKSNFKNNYERPDKPAIQKYLRELGLKSDRQRNRVDFYNNMAIRRTGRESGYSLGKADELKRIIIAHEKLPKDEEENSIVDTPT